MFSEPHTSMEVLVKSSDYVAPAEEVRLSEFFDLIASEMGLPPDHITTIIVADEANFGAAVELCAPGASFTNDSIYQAIGKTVSARDGTGRVRSSIVLLDRCVHTACAQQYVPDAVKAMAPTDDIASYAVHHEFGHCLDEERRSGVETGKGCFGTIVLEEYAACRHTARYLSKRGFDAQQGFTCQCLGAYFNCLRTARNAYRGIEDLPQLSKIEGEAVQRILLEHLKEFAFRHGNPELQSSGLRLWDCDSLLEKLLREWGDDLKSAWNAYPNCSAEFLRLGNAYFGLLTDIHG